MTELEDEDEQQIDFLSEHCKPGYHRKCNETYHFTMWGVKLRWVCTCDCHVTNTITVNF